MEPSARCAPSGEIKVSRPEYGPASRICYLQANEIVKTTARDYQERKWRIAADSGRNSGQVVVYADEKPSNVESNRGAGPPVAATRYDLGMGSTLRLGSRGAGYSYGSLFRLMRFDRSSNSIKKPREPSEINF